MKKILLYQSYSKNNIDLFNRTILNHLKYCGIHQYSLYSINQPYSMYLNIKNLIYLLQFNDLIFTLGSDCLITNLNKKIQDFIDNEHDIAICQQGSSWTLTNGQITIFKNTKTTIDFLYYLGKLQIQFSKEKCGYQSIMNKILTQKLQFYENIQLIKAGELQKYLPECDNQLNKKLKWKSCQDFILHTIGGSNKYKLDRIWKVIQQHPQLVI